MSEYRCHEHGQDFHEDCGACEAAEEWASMQDRIATLEFERDRKDEQHKYVVQKLEATIAELEVELHDQHCTVGEAEVLTMELQQQLGELADGIASAMQCDSFSTMYEGLAALLYEPSQSPQCTCKKDRQVTCIVHPTRDNVVPVDLYMQVCEDKAKLEEELQQLGEVTEELADEVEAYAAVQRSERFYYPSIMKKWELDMEPVNRARALLDKGEKDE